MGNLLGDARTISRKLQIQATPSPGFSLGGEIGGSVIRTPREKPLVPVGVTILLLIAEIQSMEAVTDPAKISTIREVIQYLHNGSKGHPVLPVLTGLSNSSDIIEESCSITRPADDCIYNIQPLSDYEVSASFGKFIRYFNIKADSDTRKIWTNRIVRWVDGWPKHLQNTMAAVGRQLITMQCDLARVDHRLIKLDAMESRTRYYERCLAPFRRIGHELAGEVLARIGASSTAREIHQLIRETLTSHGIDPTSQTTVNSMNFNTLLRRGFIYPQGDSAYKLYHCPIPSLQSYTVANAGNILHIAAENNWDRVATVLLQEGADPEIRDHQDNRPLELAREGSASHLMLAGVSVAIKDNYPTDTQQSKLTEKQSVSSSPKI